MECCKIVHSFIRSSDRRN